MKLFEQQATFAHDVSKLIMFVFDEGYYCTLGEAFRTKEQAEIYAKEGKGIVNSLHCQKLAIDLNLFSPKGEYLASTKDYQFLGDYWEKLDPKNRWGGRFSRNDGNHFERNI